MQIYLNLKIHLYLTRHLYTFTIWKSTWMHFQIFNIKYLFSEFNTQIDLNTLQVFINNFTSYLVYKWNKLSTDHLCRPTFIPSTPDKGWTHFWPKGRYIHHASWSWAQQDLLLHKQIRLEWTNAQRNIPHRVEYICDIFPPHDAILSNAASKEEYRWGCACNAAHTLA